MSVSSIKPMSYKGYYPGKKNVKEEKQKRTASIQKNIVRLGLVAAAAMAVYALTKRSKMIKSENTQLNKNNFKPQSFDSNKPPRKLEIVDNEESKILPEPFKKPNEGEIVPNKKTIAPDIASDVKKSDENVDVQIKSEEKKENIIKEVVPGDSIDKTKIVSREDLCLRMNNAQSIIDDIEQRAYFPERLKINGSKAQTSGGYLFTGYTKCTEEQQDGLIKKTFVRYNRGNETMRIISYCDKDGKVLRAARKQKMTNSIELLSNDYSYSFKLPLDQKGSVLMEKSETTDGRCIGLEGDKYTFSQISDILNSLGYDTKFLV